MIKVMPSYIPLVCCHQCHVDLHVPNVDPHVSDMHVGIDHADLQMFLLTCVLHIATGGGHTSIDHDHLTFYAS